MVRRASFLSNFRLTKLYNSVFNFSWTEILCVATWDLPPQLRQHTCTCVRTKYKLSPVGGGCWAAAGLLEKFEPRRRLHQCNAIRCEGIPTFNFQRKQFGGRTWSHISFRGGRRRITQHRLHLQSITMRDRSDDTQLFRYFGPFFLKLDLTTNNALSERSSLETLLCFTYRMKVDSGSFNQRAEVSCSSGRPHSKGSRCASATGGGVRSSTWDNE